MIPYAKNLFIDIWFVSSSHLKQTGQFKVTCHLKQRLPEKCAYSKCVPGQRVLVDCEDLLELVFSCIIIC